MESGKNYAMKVDIMKAYDLIRYIFILQVLKALGFHDTIIKWTKVCISFLKYFVIMNGELVKFLGSSKGPRQRDPLFSYLLLWL